MDSQTSSVLVQLDISKPNIQASLVDPFIPLLRGLDRRFAVCVARPPSKPFIDGDRPDAIALRDEALVATDPQSRPGKRKRVLSGTIRKPCGQVDKAAIGFCQAERDHHATIKSDIEYAIESIRKVWIDIWKEGGHSQWWAEDEVYQKSSLARLEWLSKKELDDSEEGPQWTELTRQLSPLQFIPLSPSQPGSSVTGAGLTCLNENANSVRRWRHPGKNYQITLPPRGGFSLSVLDDFANTVSALKHWAGWDLLVIDPPWENKSASRGSKYNSIELYDLFKLNLPSMLNENSGKRALVAIWVTNRPKFRRFLKHKFMPDSHIVGPYSEWYWVKITASPVIGDQISLPEGGRPIFDLESRSPRRCYEGLILGWYLPPSLRQVKPELPALPQKIFLSVPLSHSRKPHLLDLVKPYLPTDPSVLELFARTVGGFGAESSEDIPHSSQSTVTRAGWWHSIGDESPKFNGAPWIKELPPPCQ